MISNLPQHEEYLRKKRRKKIIRYSIITFIVIIFVAISSYIAHRPAIRISKVILSGGVLVTEQDVEAKSLEYMRGSYIWLFPKNNSFWYPRQSLGNYLKESFKRIDTIDMNLKNFKTLSIKITERKPVAIWCDSLPDSTTTPSVSSGSIIVSTSKCYFVDQNSTIFAEAPNFSGDAYFKYYGLITNQSPIGLEYIASTTEFAEVSQFIESARQLGLRPIYVIAKDNGEFSMIISGGGEIYFDTKIPLSSVSDNLQTLLQSAPFSTSTTDNLPIQYIDMRYGNKLFYKLK